MESAVILAGGKSRRMGRNKALLDFGGETLIERILRILGQAFDDVLISANDTENYEFPGAVVVPDVFVEGGSLAGIHAGLLRARADQCFFVACDMPFINIGLIRFLSGFTNDYDVVIPQSRYGVESRTGLEPLHAFYSCRCLPHIEEQLRRKNPKIVDFFPKVRVREVAPEEMQEYDPDQLFHFNINTEEDFDFALKKLAETK